MDNKEKALLTYKILQKRKKRKAKKIEQEYVDYEVRRMAASKKSNHVNTWR